jgi:hypothetical protein
MGNAAKDIPFELFRLKGSILLKKLQQSVSMIKRLRGRGSSLNVWQKQEHLVLIWNV